MMKSKLLLGILVLVIIGIALISGCTGNFDECDLNKDGRVDAIEKQRCGQQQLQQNGRCGDGVCQDIEKQNNVCPEDCGTTVETETCGPDNNGYCIDFREKCKTGYEGIGPDTCNRGRSAECCVPVEAPIEEEKTCSELSGTICSSSQICSGSWLSASDNGGCCSGVCEDKGGAKAEIIVNFNSEIMDVPLEVLGTLGVNYPPMATDDEIFDKSWELFKDANTYIVDVSIIGDKDVPPYFPDFNADPEDSSNYNFERLDKKLRAVIDDGYKIQLSVSDLANSPPDYDKYSLMVQRLIKHLTQGWADGFYLTSDDIRLIIYGNEPDLGFWHGSQEEFSKTYAVFVEAVKTVDESLPVGAPSYADMNKASVQAEAINFLNYLKSNNVPLDYFSWHKYGPSPYENFQVAQEVTDLVADYSSISPLYGTPKTANDEWNMKVGYGLGSSEYHEELSNEWGAAFALSSLISMIKGGLDASTWFVGMGYGGETERDFTISDTEGNLRAGFYMLKGLSNLKKANRLLSSTGDDIYGFNIMATKSDDEGTIIVFISNYNILKLLEEYPDEKALERYDFGDTSDTIYYTSYDLRISDTPWSGKTSSYSRYIVDDEHDYALVESGILDGSSNFIISEKIEMPQIQIIILSVD